jgi:hypothetical protein
MSASPKAPAPHQALEVCTIRIELRDTEPLIWREVEVPTGITLNVLHDVVQAAMGWMNQHLWEFTIAKQRFGSAGAGGWGGPPVASARRTVLRDVLKPRRTVIDYLYDFGDSWEHRLTVSAIRPGDPATPYPRYVGGEWNAPPDDCGGLPGFYNALDAFADPNHPDREELLEWWGEYDPKVIDEAAVKAALGRIAKRLQTAAAKAAKPKA